VRQVLWLDEFEPHRPFLVQRTISPAGLIRTSMLGELVPTAWDESFHTVCRVFATPRIPNIHALLEQRDVLLICHERPWFQFRGVGGPSVGGAALSDRSPAGARWRSRQKVCCSSAMIASVLSTNWR
jgi:hypothetical protein